MAPTHYLLNLAMNWAEKLRVQLVRVIFLSLLFTGLSWSRTHGTANQTLVQPPSARERLLDKVHDLQRDDPFATFEVGTLEGDGPEYREKLETMGPASKGALFEIGSIAKVLTSLTLLAMAKDKDSFIHISLEDTIERFVPELKGTPLGRKTLRDLARHKSGLPENLPSYNSKAPYPGMHEEDFIAQLKATPLVDGGRYSDIGYGLLGLVLSRAAGKPFGELLNEYVTGPLKMNATIVTAQKDSRTKLMPGYDYAKKLTPAWNIGLMDAMGGVLSTSEDMQLLVKALLHPKEDLIGQAIKQSRDQAIGWDNTEPGHDLLKLGGTAGFTSSLAINTLTNKASFILTNVHQPKIWQMTYEYAGE